MIIKELHNHIQLTVESKQLMIIDIEIFFIKERLFLILKSLIIKNKS